MKTRRATMVGLVAALMGVTAGLAGCPEDGGSLETIILFKSAGLESAVRDAIGKPFGLVLASDLTNLVELDARDLGIESLEGIENCTKLQWLDLRNNDVSDLRPLKDLTDLLFLDLENNAVTDVTPLSGLDKLIGIVLYSNTVSDIGPLVTAAESGTQEHLEYVILDPSALAVDYEDEVETQAEEDIDRLTELGCEVLFESTS